MIVDSMLKEVRQHAGLGNLPTAYYNNIPESINAIIERGVELKESEMSKFCQEMSILLLRQKDDVESAIINHGQYCLAPMFSHLEVPQDEWFQKNTNRKEACVKKFQSAKMSKSSECTSVTETASTSSGAEQARIQISVDLVNSGIKSVHLTTLRCMSEKVEKLLNKPNSIVQAPGSTDSSSFMVKSDSNMEPHHITIAKSGKVTCNDCPVWKAQKICAHSLAVAEKIGKMASYLDWFKTNGPTQINLTALVMCDSGKGVRKKGGKSSTARRKGRRNANKTAPTAIVDRQSFLPNYVTAQSTVTSPLVTTIRPPNPIQAPTSHVSQVQPFPSTLPQVLPGQSFSTPRTSQISQAPRLQSFCTTSQPQVWPPNPTQQLPMNPPQPSFTVNLLRCCPSLVRSCYGCSQSLKPGGFVVNPP